MRRPQLNVPALLAAGLAVLITGCSATAPQPDALAELSQRIEQLDRQLQHNQTAQQQTHHLSEQSRQHTLEQLERLEQRLEAMPEALDAMCAEAESAAFQTCNEVVVQKVAMEGDKMIVGRVERVWIEPPGASIIARVDTGADSSSLHAENKVMFERDGDDWVRFDVQLDGEMQTIERQVKKFVRVYQQADKDGSRRPVIELRVRLGDVQDTFEFTLADRSHLNNEMILGRNFLTDVALVDVAREFVQPVFIPPRETADAGR